MNPAGEPSTPSQPPSAAGASAASRALSIGVGAAAGPDASITSTPPRSSGRARSGPSITSGAVPIGAAATPRAPETVDQAEAACAIGASLAIRAYVSHSLRSSVVTPDSAARRAASSRPLSESVATSTRSTPSARKTSNIASDSSPRASSRPFDTEATRSPISDPGRTARVATWRSTRVSSQSGTRSPRSNTATRSAAASARTVARTLA